MSGYVTNDPLIEMLREENAQKSRGKKDPFANNPKITDNEFFNPLENKNYREVLDQMNKTNQTTTTETPKLTSLSDLLNTAQSEMRNIFNNLGTLKRLANDASDEKQTDSARDFFQRDFFETVGKIDSAAGRMNWDGMVISEGNENYKITQVNLQFAAERTSSTPETQGTENIIQNGNYSIETDGVYTLSKGYSGIVEVNAQNVKITQENSSTPLKDVSIFSSSKGYANLWIENLNIENSMNHRDSVIKFYGEGNTLSFKGNNFIKTNWSESAAIHVGNGLTLNGKDQAALNIEILGNDDEKSPSAAVIGSNPSEISTGDINIKGSIINITRGSDLGGAAIGSASHNTTNNTPQSSIGDINIQYSTINVKFGGGDASKTSIGDVNINDSIINVDVDGANTHGGAGVQTSIGDVNINDSTINVNVDNKGTHGGIGTSSGFNKSQTSIGDVNINDSMINVNVDNRGTHGGAGIGSGANASCGDINIDNSIINVDVKSGAAIGAGAGSAKVGDIRIGGGAELNLVSENGAGIGTGFGFFDDRDYFGTIGNIEIDRNAKINALRIGLGNHDSQATPGRIGALNYTNVSLNNTSVFVNEPLMDFVTNFRSRQMGNHSLNRAGFLLDDFSGQSQRPSTEIRLGFMHPRFLGTGNLLSHQGKFLNPFDQNMFDSFFGNTSKQNDWMDIVRGASNQNLSSINILSQRSASIALRVIEGAISQVQSEMTVVNSYIQRFTQSPSSDDSQNIIDNERHLPLNNFV